MGYYYDTDVIANDEFLTKYLAKNKEMVLGEIIATIQKEQNEIIRDTPWHSVIVQGVAGSGKTTVAMHRISYLLYNYKERLRQEENEADYKQFKGSLEILRLLEVFLKQYELELIPTETVEYHGQVIYRSEDILQLIHTFPMYPAQEKIDMLNKRLLHKVQMVNEQEDQEKEVIRAELKKQKDYFGKKNKKLDLVGIYTKFLIRLSADGRKKAMIRYDTAAVICSNMEEAGRVSGLLSGRIPIEPLPEHAEDVKFVTGIMVLPIHLTKGLEFDTVLLWNPNSLQYPATDANAKLLYVAVTRALHECTIVYRGALSKLLSEGK